MLHVHDKIIFQWHWKRNFWTENITFSIYAVKCRLYNIWLNKNSYCSNSMSEQVSPKKAKSTIKKWIMSKIRNIFQGPFYKVVVKHVICMAQVSDKSDFLFKYTKWLISPRFIFSINHKTLLKFEKPCQFKHINRTFIKSFIDKIV